MSNDNIYKQTCSRQTTYIVENVNNLFVFLHNVKYDWNKTGFKR